MLHRDVAQGVHRIEDFGVNWYLVEDGDAVTIFDAGLPRSWGALQAALETLGRTPQEIEALVLTHAHPDHVGFAERIRAEWHVPVWLHERDATLSRHPMNYEKESGPLPYLRRPSVYTALGKMLAGGVLATKPIGELRAFDDEPELEVPGRPVPVRTPGHTHGHTSFHLPDRDVVIAGDALVTWNPYRGKTGPQLISAASNVDSVEALASLQRLAETGAATLLPGHGEPWTGGAEEAVRIARETGTS